MKRSRSSPPHKTATGTQKWMSVRMLAARLRDDSALPMWGLRFLSIDLTGWHYTSRVPVLRDVPEA
ncbi:MAG TPA: hypothetical protein VEI54_13215 [Candidatus Limnocylindrales bacterium]|nr:hypothetical protein [Candidatus Limnocylindrales bacterium]